MRTDKEWLAWLNNQPIGTYIDMIDCQDSLKNRFGLVFRFVKTVNGWYRVNYEPKTYDANDLAAWDTKLRELTSIELMELLTRDSR